MHLRKAIKNMYINPSAAILLRYLQFTSQSWCYVEYDINTKTNNTMKYEHDNHNTITFITLHRTICEANTEQPIQPTSKQQEQAAAAAYSKARRKDEI